MIEEAVNLLEVTKLTEDDLSRLVGAIRPRVAHWLGGEAERTERRTQKIGVPFSVERVALLR